MMPLRVCVADTIPDLTCRQCLAIIFVTISLFTNASTFDEKNKNSKMKTDFENIAGCDVRVLAEYYSVAWFDDEYCIGFRQRTMMLPRRLSCDL